MPRVTQRKQGLRAGARKRRAVSMKSLAERDTLRARRLAADRAESAAPDPDVDAGRQVAATARDFDRRNTSRAEHLTVVAPPTLASRLALAESALARAGYVAGSDGSWSLPPSA